MHKEKYIVYHKCGSYQVMVYINGNSKYVGLYSTIAEAVIGRDNFLKINGIKNISRTNENHYVENREMMKEVIISKAMGKITPRLLQQCIKVVKGVSKKFKYNDEDDRLDCEAYAYEVIIKNWYHFNELKFSNAFAYYTEIVKRAFAFQWKVLQKTRLNTISLDYTDDEGKKMFNI
jgi:hypothetical protein